MAKKKNPNRRGNPEAETQVNTEVEQEKLSFEIGVKGDEFERRYRRAAMSSSATGGQAFKQPQPRIQRRQI